MTLEVEMVFSCKLHAEKLGTLVWGPISSQTTWALKGYKNIENKHPAISGWANRRYKSIIPSPKEKETAKRTKPTDYKQQL